MLKSLLPHTAIVLLLVSCGRPGVENPVKDDASKTQASSSTSTSAKSDGSQIPDALRGKWTVMRVIPTARTIGCWGDTESKALLKTEIEYSADIFRWKDVITRSPEASTQVLTAKRFYDENSGGSANGNQITLPELGITSDQVTEVSITHEPAEITRATVEIPGDQVLLKDNNTIILSVCGVYFEAQRSATK